MPKMEARTTPIVCAVVRWEELTEAVSVSALGLGGMEMVVGG